MEASTIYASYYYVLEAYHLYGFPSVQPESSGLQNNRMLLLSICEMVICNDTLTFRLQFDAGMSDDFRGTVRMQ